MPYRMGTVPLVLGFAIGFGGFFVWTYEECTLFLGACIQTARPYETAGLLVMIFGGVLTVICIISMSFISPGQHPSPPPTPGGRYCPNCGTPNPLEARFCISCGTELPTG